MKTLFQAGGPLSPESTAFDKSIYRRSQQGSTVALGAVNYVPQVIGSPRLSGKTTQVNTIIEYHERLAGSEPLLLIICEIPSKDPQVNEESLRSLLARHLCARPEGSLRDILSSSPLLGRTRSVLAIINSEKIAHDALRWLLSGFKGLHDDHSLRRDLKVQLLIDGSFSVDTLTSGPDSDYPLPQIYPPEFTRQEQFAFLTSRLAPLRLTPTDAALQALWECTSGDKYLTQAAGRYLSETVSHQSVKAFRQIDAQELEGLIEHPQSWHELFAQAADTIGSVVLEMALQYESAEDFLDQLADDWQNLPVKLKALSYDGGLVRRTGSATISLRAPMLTESLKCSLKRAKCSLAFLHSAFSISGVSRDDRPRAIEAVRQVLQLSARGELGTIHVGQGQVVGSGVKVNASALEGGSYEAIWSLPTESYPDESQLWVLLWTSLSAGARRTEQQIFGVREIDGQDVEYIDTGR